VSSVCFRTVEHMSASSVDCLLLQLRWIEEVGNGDRGAQSDHQIKQGTKHTDFSLYIIKLAFDGSEVFV
jgi:hypothetical protein